MPNINEIVYKFINKMHYSKEDIIGIVVCGSSITGYATKNSDVDINVIKNNRSQEIIRGVITIDGYKFEYFEKPISDYYKELAYAPRTQKGALLSIIGNGQIICDKDNQIKKLQDAVLEKYSEPLPILEGDEAKEIIAIIDNRMIRLEESYNQNRIDFESIYYLLLERLRKFYSRRIGCISIPPEKSVRVYTDFEYAKSYCGGSVPNQEFIDLYTSALAASSRIAKMTIIKEIYQYVTKGIEFNPDNYRIYIKSRYNSNNK